MDATGGNEKPYEHRLQDHPPRLVDADGDDDGVQEEMAGPGSTRGSWVRCPSPLEFSVSPPSADIRRPRTGRDR